MLIFIILFIIILVYFTSEKTSEHFDQQELEKQKNSIKDRTVVRKLDLLNDPVFNDVVYYENDPNPYAPDQSIGLYKCYKNCSGNCVEFGVTGNAMCFAKRN